MKGMGDPSPIPQIDWRGVQFAWCVPTIADRVAQTVVKMVLEPEVEPIFHPASYGYRPGRSALDAVGAARERCWKFDWVIDLDIKSFFDTIPHDLIEKAVARHTELGWERRGGTMKMNMWKICTTARGCEHLREWPPKT
jgi:retron-type reverse transcriptase